MKPDLHILVVAALTLCAVGCRAEAAGTDLRFKEEFLRRLVACVPSILKSQNPNDGRFGTGIWISTDQNPIYPLSVAWATESSDNPYYHDAKVLDAIMAGGDILIEEADEQGMWRFDKKDGSFWGMTHQCWIYSRWMRAYSLIKDAMPPDRRKKWEDALTLGYTNIAKSQLGHVHNIPTHHAMGLYFAGQALGKPEWCEQSRQFMVKVVARQDPGGFWSENHGPVVGYDFVYVDALGTYYAVSGDKTVLPALERASKFHAAFVYPNGSCVETVDERNPYNTGPRLGNVGFTFSAEGRGFIAQQLGVIDSTKRTVHQDDLASLILYGEEGPTVPTPAAQSDRTFVLTGDKALIRRKGPWFVCLSAYNCPIPGNRWIQDRQNLVSIYHDRTGLIVGGGNTKLQPLWSTFSVGDISLLKHKPGDENPKFTPEGSLWHVPSGGALTTSDPVGLKLKYGPEYCAASVEIANDSKLNLRLRSTAKSGEPVEAHLTLIPHLKLPFKTESGIEKNLEKDQFTLTADEAGGWISQGLWRITLPEGSKVIWPAQPHNPYVKDGSPKTLDESRVVISVPITKNQSECVLRFAVL